MSLRDPSSFLAGSETAHNQALPMSSCQPKVGVDSQTDEQEQWAPKTLQLQLPSLCHPGLRRSQTLSPQDTSPAQTNTFWAFLILS